IDACRREIGQLTTKINELAQLYMANHPERNGRNQANQTAVAGSG
ncbi:unnamed protein product, partial [Rotaria magnacalcarata]